jgi:hypothetical protein
VVSGTIVVNSSFSLAADQTVSFANPFYGPSGGTVGYTAAYLLKPAGAAVTAQPITFTSAGFSR